MNIAETLPNPPIQLPTFTLSKWRLRFLTLVAVGLVVMGILCNLIFYSEFGQGFSSIVYASNLEISKRFSGKEHRAMASLSMPYLN